MYLPDTKDLADMTCDQLQTLLRRYSKRVTGVKIDLLERVVCLYLDGLLFWPGDALLAAVGKLCAERKIVASKLVLRSAADARAFLKQTKKK